MRAQPTGIELLDELLGGLTPGLPCVLSGASGSGRTVFALSAVGAALQAGRVVTLLCNEPAPFLLAQAESLSLDFRSAISRGQLALLEMDVDISSAVTGLGADALVQAISDEQPLTTLLVIDPFTALTSGLFDESHLRASARAFAKAARDLSVILTVERERLALQQGLERTLGEICGAFVSLECSSEGARRIRLEKTRSGVHSKPSLPFRIDSEGLHLLSAETPRDDAVDASLSSVPERREREATPGEDAPAAPAPRGRARHPERLALEASGGATRRPVVLLVDWDEASRNRCEKWLEGLYEVRTARDGFEAMTALLSEQPDLLVTELMMPRLTGYELLAATRRADLRVPCLVVSEHVQRPGDKLAPLVLGATDVLGKPVERFELLHKVETLLRIGRPAQPMLEAVDAEALFASVSKSRVVSSVDFHDRLDRVERLGERLHLASSLTTIAADSKDALEQLLAVCDAELRFQDAVLRVSARRAVVLLVATDWEDAPAVIERLCARFIEGGGRPERTRFETASLRRVPADFDWHELFRAGGPESESADEGPETIDDEGKST